MVKKVPIRTRATAVVTLSANLNVSVTGTPLPGLWVVYFMCVNYHKVALARALQKKSPF